MENYSQIFYLYRKDTLQKMIKQIESESMQSNNLLPFIEDAPQPQIQPVSQSSKYYPLFEEYRRIKEGRYTFQKKKK